MSRTEIIVEIAQAHDGSLGVLHSMVEALVELDIDAIKFQTHIADAESSPEETFRVPFSYVDQTRQDYWRRMEFSPEQWAGIKKKVEAGGKEFMSSAFSIAAFELLESLDMKRYKIASGEVQNYLMLKRIAETGKPILLSSGMSSFDQLQETLDFLKPFGNEVSIFQCTTSYPTPASKVGLNVIPEMIERFGIPVGLSDHSGEIYPSLAAVSLGASMLEFHFTFSKEMFGPDATSSLDLNQLKQLVDGVRFIDEMHANPVDKSDNEAFRELSNLFGKSLSAKTDFNSGQEITEGMLETTKPGGMGIPAKDFEKVLGKKVKRAMQKGTFVTWDDLE